MPDYRLRPPVDEPHDPLAAIHGMWTGLLASLLLWIIIIAAVVGVCVAAGVIRW